jgi:hypothetical protein
VSQFTLPAFAACLCRSGFAQAGSRLPVLRLRRVDGRGRSSLKGTMRGHNESSPLSKKRPLSRRYCVTLRRDSVHAVTCGKKRRDRRRPYLWGRQSRMAPYSTKHSCHCRSLSAMYTVLRTVLLYRFPRELRMNTSGGALSQASH